MTQNLSSNVNSLETIGTHESKNRENSDLKILEDNVTRSSVNECTGLSGKSVSLSGVHFTLLGDSFTEVSKITATIPGESLGDSGTRFSLIRSCEKETSIGNNVSDSVNFTFEKLSFQFKPIGMSTPEFRRKTGTKFLKAINSEDLKSEIVSTSLQLCNKSLGSSGKHVTEEKTLPQSSYSRPEEFDVSSELRDTKVEHCDMSLCTNAEVEVDPITKTFVPVEASPSPATDSKVTDSSGNLEFHDMLSQLTLKTEDEYSISQDTTRKFFSTVLLNKSANGRRLVSSLENLRLTESEEYGNKSDEPITRDASFPSVYVDTLLQTAVGCSNALYETVCDAPEVTSLEGDLTSLDLSTELQRAASNENLSTNSDSNSSHSNEFTVINRNCMELSSSFVRVEGCHVKEPVNKDDPPNTENYSKTEVLDSINQSASLQSSVRDLQRPLEDSNDSIINLEKSVEAETSLNSELFTQLYQPFDSVITNELDVTSQTNKPSNSYICVEADSSVSEEFCGFKDEIMSESNAKVEVIHDLIRKFNKDIKLGDLSSCSSSGESLLTCTVVSKSVTDKSEDDNEVSKDASRSFEKVVEKHTEKSEMVKSAGFERYHKNLISTCQKFETVVEENAEEVTEDVIPSKDTKSRSSTAAPPDVRGNFTERKKKRCPLPPLLEEENEKDTQHLQNSVFEKPSIRLNEKSMTNQSLYLSKGKKWRRSFIALKNIRDLGLNKETLDDENKGRCYRQNIENLICSQQNVSVLKGKCFLRIFRFVQLRFDSR